MADKKKGKEPERPAYTLPDDPQEAMKQLKADRKQLKEDQKAQAKEARLRAREMEEAQAELTGDDGGGLGAFLLVVLVVLIWLLLMAILIKYNIFGLGNTMTPVLKDVPYIRNILPNSYLDSIRNEASSQGGSGDVDYTYLADLEKKLSEEIAKNAELQAQIEKLQAEVARLEPFEQEQINFEKERQKFYEEIVYNDNAPDPSAYASYYEMIDPDMAASLYAEVSALRVSDDEVKIYAATYSAMKPKEAAAIFDEMSNITLVARILQQMSSDDRGRIIAKMDVEVAEKVTELLEPPGLPALSNQNAANGT